MALRSLISVSVMPSPLVPTLRLGMRAGTLREGIFLASLTHPMFFGIQSEYFFGVRGFCSESFRHDGSADDSLRKGKSKMEKDKRVYKKICNGRYAIVKVLGKGAMGCVYLAHDAESGKEVALKMVPREVSDVDYEMEELKKNYDKVESLHHPHIAAVKHLVKVPETGEYALMMEYVPGKTLLEYRRARPGRKIELDQAVRFACEVADGLDYAHKRGIIHRDIKPENVIVTEDNEAKIVDFGLAMRIKTIAARHSKEFKFDKSGTYEYMSPEQWKGRRQDQAADIYALGVLTYEMIAGVRPFEISDPTVLMNAVLHHDPEPLPPEVPRKIDAAIRKAMAKKKEDRFQTAGEFAQALKKGLEENDRPKPVAVALVVAALLAVAGWFSFDWLSNADYRRVSRLTKEQIAGPGATDFDLSVADASLDLIQDLIRRKKATNFTVAVAGVRHVSQDLGCPAFSRELKDKVETYVFQINKAIDGSFGGAERGGEYIDRLENEILISSGNKVLVDFDAANNLPPADIYITGHWKNHDKDVALDLKLFAKEEKDGRLVYSSLMKSDSTILKSGLDSAHRRCLAEFGGGEPTTVVGTTEPPGKPEPPPPPETTLTINPDPKNARIEFLNSQETFVQGMRIKTGSYRVRASADGYYPKEMDLELTEQDKSTFDIALKKMPPRPGDVTTIRFDQDPNFGDLILEMAYIPPGTFHMGSPDGEPERDNDENQHWVKLTEGFYMQTTEVTQKQWRAVMKNDPSYFKDCDDCPVENVSWNDAREFIGKLNQYAKAHGIAYRFKLPSEAQWEYAARAETDTPFYFGRCLSTDQANYDGNYPLKGCEKEEKITYRKKTVGVKSLGEASMNKWGLYGMHGNVWEWCSDKYEAYPAGKGKSESDPVIDPEVDQDGTEKSAGRVLRGGSWSSRAWYCRSANRLWNEPVYRGDYVGLRLAALF